MYKQTRLNLRSNKRWVKMKMRSKNTWIKNGNRKTQQNWWKNTTYEMSTSACIKHMCKERPNDDSQHQSDGWMGGWKHDPLVGSGDHRQKWDVAKYMHSI